MAKKGSKKQVTPKPVEEEAGASGKAAWESDDGEFDQFGQIGNQSPKTSQHWTAAKERQLCQLWEVERHLYDASVRDYRNSRRRQNAYARFARALEMDGKYF